MYFVLIFCRLKCPNKTDKYVQQFFWSMLQKRVSRDLSDIFSFQKYKAMDLQSKKNALSKLKKYFEN